MLSRISISMVIRRTRLARTVCPMCIVRISRLMMGLKSRVWCFGSKYWKERKEPELKLSPFYLKNKRNGRIKMTGVKIDFFSFSNWKCVEKWRRGKNQNWKQFFVLKMFILFFFSSLFFFPFFFFFFLPFSSFSFLFPPSFFSFFFRFLRKRENESLKSRFLSKINGSQRGCCRENSCEEKIVKVCTEYDEVFVRKGWDVCTRIGV